MIFRDHKGKKLKDIKSVDDLFKDFYDKKTLFH